MKNRNKKILSLLLAVLLCVLTLAGCEAAPLEGDEQESSNPDESTGTEVTEEQSEAKAVRHRIYTEDASKISVSFANYIGSDTLSGINSDLLGTDDARHLPLLRFDTFAELTQFRETDYEMLTVDRGWDEVPSFNSVTSEMDEAYFDEYSVFVIYVASHSCTLRFAVDGIKGDGNALCFYVVQTNDPQYLEEMMAGWFLTVSLPKSILVGYTSFDAVRGEMPPWEKSDVETADTSEGSAELDESKETKDPADADEPVSQIDVTAFITTENGNYAATLALFQQTIRVPSYYTSYLSRATDEQLQCAEAELLEILHVNGESDKSPTYLTLDNEGYLCLAVEIIRAIDPPDTQIYDGHVISGGCDIDHKHVFYSARITR